ncbi:hypothetical protein D3C84_154380 [compost metagenome]
MPLRTVMLPPDTTVPFSTKPPITTSPLAWTRMPGMTSPVTSSDPSKMTWPWRASTCLTLSTSSTRMPLFSWQGRPLRLASSRSGSSAETQLPSPTVMWLSLPALAGSVWPVTVKPSMPRVAGWRRISGAPALTVIRAPRSRMSTLP